MIFGRFSFHGISNLYIFMNQTTKPYNIMSFCNKIMTYDVNFEMHNVQTSQEVWFSFRLSNIEEMLIINRRQARNSNQLRLS